MPHWLGRGAVRPRLGDTDPQSVGRSVGATVEMTAAGQMAERTAASQRITHEGTEEKRGDGVEEINRDGWGQHHPQRLEPPTGQAARDGIERAVHRLRPRRPRRGWAAGRWTGGTSRPCELHAP